MNELNRQAESLRSEPRDQCPPSPAPPDGRLGRRQEPSDRDEHARAGRWLMAAE